MAESGRPSKLLLSRENARRIRRGGNRARQPRAARRKTEREEKLSVLAALRGQEALPDVSAELSRGHSEETPDFLTE
jgi:hypothetical protein